MGVVRGLFCVRRSMRSDGRSGTCIVYRVCIGWLSVLNLVVVKTELEAVSGGL